MMGQLPSGQNALFYEFRIDNHVPPDHLLRQIDQVIHLSFLRQHLASFYSHTGRPSIDPELMIRMLIIGYCYGIRSERRLCEEVHLNLAYRWFCRLGLEDEVPNHSTFSKNRHGRFRESDVFRCLFEEVVQRCIEEGLVGGEGFAVDASTIRADVNWERAVPGKDILSNLNRDEATRPVREYLDALDKNEVTRTTPKKISLTDPQSQWASNRKGAADFSYSTNYLIDIKNNIIIDTEATPTYRISEVESTKTMINRVEDNFGIKPKRLLGDTAYGSAPMLEWLVAKKNIEPHIPVWDKSDGKEGLFGRADFTWEAEGDRYRCPAGKYLQRGRRNFTTPRPNVGLTKDNTILYRSAKVDCDSCEHKMRCCPVTPHRKIARSIFEDSRDVARAIAKTPEYEQSRNDRKKVEVVFGHMKNIHNFERLRLRGILGAQEEFLLVAISQNLRRLAKLRYRPPPDKRFSTPV
jgi:transposase